MGKEGLRSFSFTNAQHGAIHHWYVHNNPCSMYYIVVERCSLVWITGPVGVIAMYTQLLFRVNNVKRTHTENQFD